jgi:two-component system sensor histidine kinase MprB
MTLRNRISLAAATGVLLVVAAVSVVVYLAYSASLSARVDAALVDAAQQASKIAQQIKQGHQGTVPNFSALTRLGTVDVQLFPGPVAAGQPTYFGALDTRAVAVAQHAAPAYFADVNTSGDRFRVYTAAWPGTSSDGALVRSSRSTSADDGPRRTAAILLASLTAAAAGVTFGLARLASGRVLRPLADLSTTIEHVTATRDLNARLNSCARDEIGRLSASFDLMLAALSDSVTAQQRLVADAAHELRTPLTSLTTNLELLEDGAGLAHPQAPALVRAAHQQSGELSDLVTDLLDLARYQERPPHHESTRLDLLADEVVHRLALRVPQARVETDLRPCVVDVDPAGADRAIANLIDNAAKWTAPGTTIRVTVAEGAVSVRDHGPGVPDEDLPHIFERFYRASSARSTPGAGLGLAIVGSVAKANNATIDVRTSPAGSTFTVAFPSSPEGAED